MENPGPSRIEQNPITGLWYIIIEPVSLLTDVGSWDVVFRVDLDRCEEYQEPNVQIPFKLTVLIE